MMTNDIEWKMVKLGEVIQHLRTGLNPRDNFKLNTTDAQGYYITVRELKGFDIVTDEKTDRINNEAIAKINERSKLMINDVLFSGTGTIGETALVKENPYNWGIKEGIYAITPDLEKLDPRFLLYYFQTTQAVSLLDEMSTGSTIKSVPMAKLKVLPIPIPYKNGSPDLETQAIIAQKISEMDNLIASKEKLLAKKRHLKVAAMQKLIKDEEGENWKKVKLGDVAEFLPTNTLSRDELNYSEGEYLNIHYGDVLIKFESVTDVLNSEIPYVSLNKKFSDKSLLKNGDIVMADTAEDESVGKVTEIQNIGNCKVVSGLHTLCIRFQENLFAPKFAGYYLNSPAFHNLLLPYMHGTKVTSISKGDVKKINFPIPYKNSAPDLTEQRRIASILSDVDSEIAAIEKEITKLQKLKTAMMQKMFCFEDSDSSSE